MGVWIDILYIIFVLSFLILIAALIYGLFHHEWAGVFVEKLIEFNNSAYTRVVYVMAVGGF